MTVGLSRLGFCVLFFSLLETVLSPFSIAQSLPSAQTLELNQPVTRELAGGQNYVYRVAAHAGQYLEAILEQRGVDVVVSLFAPDGQRVAQFDGDSRPQGQETVVQIV